MREVSPGDIIFSFRDTRIAALGTARSYCYESPKPTEFGTAVSRVSPGECVEDVEEALNAQ
jgi:hypothetical protein